MNLKTLLMRGLAVVLTASFITTGAPYIAAASDISEKNKAFEEDILTDSDGFTQLDFGKEYTDSVNQRNKGSYEFTVNVPGRLIL